MVSGFKEHILNIIKDFQAYNIDKKKVLCSMDLLDALEEASDETLEDLHVIQERDPEWFISMQDHGDSIPVPSDIDSIDVSKGTFADVGNGVKTLVDIDFDGVDDETKDALRPLIAEEIDKQKEDMVIQLLKGNSFDGTIYYMEKLTETELKFNNLSFSKVLPKH